MANLGHPGGATPAPGAGPSARYRSIRPLLVTFGSVSHPDGGTQVRSRLTAEILTELGAQPVIVCTRETARAPACPEWATRLRFPQRKPVKGFSFGLARLIGQESRHSTVLIVTNAMFLPAVALSWSRLPMIWDPTECQTLHYRRLSPSWANRGKYIAWMLLERWAARRCRIAVAISDEEAIAWSTIHPRLKEKLATVDHAAFWSAPGPDPRRELERRAGRTFEGPVLLFLGTMRAKHNAAAAGWILDTLVDSLPPGVTVVLCGPGTEHLPRPESAPARVVALGAVDDVDSVVAAADLCLAPLAAGAGVKTKVLHYLAHGKPVAGTATAFEGLAGAPGLFAAPLQELPALIRRLCRDTEGATAAAARGRAQQEWLEVHHGRAHVKAQWEKVLRCLPTR